MSPIEKLELIKDLFEKLGYDFSNVKVDDCFSLFNKIETEVKEISTKK